MNIEISHIFRKLRILKRLNQIERKINLDIDQERINSCLDKLPVYDYQDFEDRFRGSSQLIKKRQRPYIKYFKGCRAVIDIGCGRGEFLELLQKNKIGYLGIDSNVSMVNECKRRGLNVENRDAFEYLVNSIDNSYDGLAAFQVIEHMEPIRIQNFIKLCFDKVQKNSYVIVETVNPLNPGALGHFWADLTHVKPLVPAVLKYIFEHYGFSEVKIAARTAVVEGIPKFAIDPSDMSLYGDYAILAKK